MRGSRIRTGGGVLVCLTAAYLPAGCGSQSPPAVAGLSPPTSPRATFEYLRACYAQRSYVAMRPYMDPAQADNVIDLLLALDELLAANAGAQQAVREVRPGYAAEQYDLAPLADCLDLFSRDVQYAGQQEEGDAAIVRAQISGHLPLSELRFERRGPRWVYLPGGGAAELTPAIREIAAALDQIRIILTLAPQTVEDVGQEYRLRVTPRLQPFRLAPATRPA